MSIIEDLQNRLKTKGLTDSSIKLYMNHLKKLNNGEEVVDLKMLKKPDDVLNTIKDMKDTTQKSYLTAIVSMLSCFPDDKKMQKLRASYYVLVNNIVDKLKETPSSQLSKVQADNWMDWTDIIKIYDDMKVKILLLVKGKKTITDTLFSKLLDFMVLSCYVEIPPRRNTDFMNMKIKNDVTDADSKEFNYLDLKNKEFIFNMGKTSKIYPDTKIAIPEDLLKNIILYLKYHPSSRQSNKKDTDSEPFFLVHADGSSFTNGNSITRILNKIFKKNIGVSMLRHSYLTYKYGDINEDKIQTAKNMGHSVVTQGEYIKSV